MLPTVSCPGEPDGGDRGGEQPLLHLPGGGGGGGGPSLTGHLSDDAELVVNQPR